VLLVRKTRGPYSGLLDLPGGAPQPGEIDRLVTLRREIAEEAGILIDAVGAWHDFQFPVEKDSRGKRINFTHAGAWAIATARSVPPSEIVSADTAGTVWVPLRDWQRRSDLSALTTFVLAASGIDGASGDRLPPH
jgi:8-oxo-dGTP pyrophosphatase MutT (NUDIX family)